MAGLRMVVFAAISLCMTPLVLYGQVGADGFGRLPGDAGGGEMGDATELLWFLLCVLGAIVSGSILAYHPHLLRRVASISQVDAPKIFITYTSAIIKNIFLAEIVNLNWHFGNLYPGGFDETYPKTVLCMLFYASISDVRSGSTDRSRTNDHNAGQSQEPFGRRTRAC